MELKERLIVSLDFETDSQALALVAELHHEVIFYKIGMQLFYHYGPALVKKIKNQGVKIFLDLKLHDIPNTVVSALQSLKDLDVDFINMHTLAGTEAMAQAKDYLLQQQWNTKLIGVTVLTSLNNEHLRQIGFQHSLTETVIQLCRLAKNAKLDGVVASAQEAASIKEQCGNDFITICPGIRRATDSVNDQKRIVTPAEAIAKSADYIVVGRPIIQAQDPKKEAKLYFEEMEKGIQNARK